ncbi:MAG: long-chain fatty acid--CoA ligase [Clostridia bacterium]|nr:long-chain fatty acid--CoA ligase [Clostridia bacterium]
MRVDNLHLANSRLKDIAISHRGRKISFEEFEERVQRFAGYLKSLGIKEGDRVALTAPNSPEFIFSYWAINRIGAVAVPLNLTLTLEEIAYIIRNSGANSLIVHPVILEKVGSPDVGGLGLKKIILLDESTLKKIYQTERYTVSSAELGEDSLSAILYTSGTTGRPKGAMLTHKNFFSNVISLTKVMDITPDDKFLCVLPMFHSFAWTVCVLLPLYCGGTVVVLESFQPAETIRTIAGEGVTFLLGVPPMYAVFYRKAKGEHFKSLRIAVSGGAPLSAELYKAFVEKFPVNFVEGYGLTEASPVVCVNPIYGIKKPGSIGLPIPDVEVIIGDEKGNEVPRGEIGEILVKGGNVMVGYYNDEEATREAFVNGWLRTGDMAMADEDGYIYIVDRKKDLIIMGGFNVYPREIEELLLAHPKVAEAAVVGVNDPLRGEVPKAFIAPVEGEKLTDKEIQAFLKGKLAHYKMPRVIEFVDSLPKNAAGKVMKKLLREN